MTLTDIMVDKKRQSHWSTPGFQSQILWRIIFPSIYFFFISEVLDLKNAKFKRRQKNVERQFRYTEQVVSIHNL